MVGKVLHASCFDVTLCLLTFLVRLGLFFFFFKYLFFLLSTFSTQHGAQTRNPEIKSRMLPWVFHF